MCATNQCDCSADPIGLRVPLATAPAGTEGGEILESVTKNVASFGFGHPAHIPKTARIGSITEAGHSTYTSKLLTIAAKLTSHPKIRAILRTSQPVHALAIIAVGIVYSCLTTEGSTTPKPYSSVTTFLYVTSLALRVGSQYWMTFVSGLSLYFTLQRHAFGDVQVVLFPRYFTSNAILSAICLFSYTKLHSHIPWTTDNWIQVTALSTSFLLESLARLYLAPKVVELIKKKTAIEKTQPGVGTEVGRHEPGALAACPHYMALHRQFRLKHMGMAIVNITTIASTILQLIHLSQSICFTP